MRKNRKRHDRKSVQTVISSEHKLFDLHLKETFQYRDLQHAVGFGVQLWQYASPIAYGLTLISGKVLQLMWLYMLNPITPIITTFRYAIFGFGYFNIGYYLLSWAMTLIIFFIGVIMFSKIERTFMDTI